MLSILGDSLDFIKVIIIRNVTILRIIRTAYIPFFFQNSPRIRWLVRVSVGRALLYTLGGEGRLRDLALAFFGIFSTDIVFA